MQFDHFCKEAANLGHFQKSIIHWEKNYRGKETLSHQRALKNLKNKKLLHPENDTFLPSVSC